jgi:hypothetical protein
MPETETHFDETEDETAEAAGTAEETASKGADAASSAKDAVTGSGSKTQKVAVPLIAGLLAGAATYAARRGPDVVRELSRRIQNGDVGSAVARLRDADVVKTLLSRTREVVEQAGGAKEAVTDAARHVAGSASSTTSGSGDHRSADDAQRERQEREQRRATRQKRSTS